MPLAFEYLWTWFIRMSNRRGGGFGASPLTHTGIKAFFELVGIWPTPWDVEQLEILDDLYLRTLEGAKTKKGYVDKTDK